MHDPRVAYMSSLHRILRYIKGTLDHGLQLYKSSISSLLSYTDADWGGCPDTRRSTSGYCVFLDDNLISRSAKRQPTVSMSSVEAEYRGVANVVSETCWIRNLLLEIHFPIYTTTLVYCDNVNAVYLSSNPVHHQRTKILRWTYILFKKKSNVGKSGFFMFHLDIRLLTFLPRDFLRFFSMIFAAVSASVNPPIRLRGCIKSNHIYILYILHIL